MSKRTALILAALAAAALSIAACSNTLHGVGRDMQNTGRTIDNAF